MLNAQKLIKSPTDTIFILITDLFEGGSQSQFLKKAASFKSAGVQFVVLLALDDQGAPSYDRQLASKLASMNIPAFACTPDKFPELMEIAISGGGMDKMINLNTSNS